MTVAHQASHHNQSRLIDVTAPLQVATRSRTDGQPRLAMSTGRQRLQLPQLLCPAHLCCLASTTGCTQCKSSAAWQLSGNALVPSKPTSRVAPARQNALGERHGHMETSDEDQWQFQVIA